MKAIALIGAPGAGKTKLASAIANELIRGDGQCEECNTPVAVVDGYAEKIRDHGSYEIGLDGGYMVNLAISLERYNQERTAAFDHAKTIITCGTVLESAVYLAQHFERSLALKAEGEEQMQEVQRIEASIKALAMMYMDTFKYDKAFYVPPLALNEDPRWATFDRNLQASFSAYNAPVVPLLVEEFEDEKDLIRQQVERVLG